MRSQPLAHILRLAIALPIIATVFAEAALAAAPITLTFITHAAFFSRETHQSKRMDPQVFVRDKAVPAAAGPQNIQHAAGFRPALSTDPAKSQLYSASGQPLGFTLGQWLAAKGTVLITPLASGARIVARFTGLRPNGVYSLFQNHFDQKPVGFTPLDGTGESNSFQAKADGSATITVTAPAMLTRDNAVLLVYHSDRTAHGASRGEIGIDAHHQLIARPHQQIAG